MLAGRGDLRGACDKFLAAALAAPSVWSPHRFKCFMMHTMILRELHFKASESDIKTLRKKFLRNVKEPPHFRVQASFALGVLETNRGDRETAAERYREGLIIAREASPEDKAKTVQSDEGPVSVAHLIETDSKTIESNLSILSGTGQTMEKHPCEYKRDFGKKDAMPPIGDTITLTRGVLEHDSFSEENLDVLARLMERATMVGGNACDGCGKTLQDLGLDKFECCSRCNMAYYCSKSCQREAWRAGHKKACRKPDEIRAGDCMMLTGLKKRPEMNGKVVRIMAAAEKEGRWMVTEKSTTYTNETTCVSIATGNLRHIRPAK